MGFSRSKTDPLPLTHMSIDFDFIGANIIFCRIHVATTQYFVSLSSVIDSNTREKNFEDSHSSRYRYHKRCKSSISTCMIRSLLRHFFLFFVSFVHFREFLLCISSCVGIKHPYIKKCYLTCLTKYNDTYVQPHFVFSGIWWSKRFTS